MLANLHELSLASQNVPATFVVFKHFYDIITNLAVTHFGFSISLF